MIIPAYIGTICFKVGNTIVVQQQGQCVRGRSTYALFCPDARLLPYGKSYSFRLCDSLSKFFLFLSFFFYLCLTLSVAKRMILKVLENLVIFSGLLFHRVILMSGSALSPWAHVSAMAGSSSGSAASTAATISLTNGKDVAKRFAQRVKCPSEPPSSMLQCLRQIPLQYYVESEVRVDVIHSKPFYSPGSLCPFRHIYMVGILEDVII